MAELAPREILIGVGALSLATAVVSALMVPVLLVRIPAEHFYLPPVPLRARWRGAGWGGRVSLLFKNLAGVVLLALGSLMLLTPGQGVLTTLIGLAMVDFPGKRALEQRILARPGVRSAVNKLRARYDRPPLRLPGDAH